MPMTGPVMNANPSSVNIILFKCLMAVYVFLL
jgi:hypothetical protein